VSNAQDWKKLSAEAFEIAVKETSAMDWVGNSNTSYHVRETPKYGRAKHSLGIGTWQQEPELRPEAVKAKNQEPPPRIQLVPFNQIKLGTERRYLVKGLIPCVGITIVWGPPKCGKSFVVFDIAMHAALGWFYRGRRLQQGPVVYCAFEGAKGFEGRSEAYRQKYKLEGQEIPFYLEPLKLNLVRDHKALIATIRRDLGQSSPVLVVLDTLNRSLQGSESKDEDMTAYFEAADAIREAFECAVIIIHHCGVDGSRPRGHTSLTGGCEAQIAISRDGAKNIIAAVEYMKDGEDGATIISRLENMPVGLDEDGAPITSCVVVPAEKTETPANEPACVKTLCFIMNGMIPAI
jgi:hypothetical protein